MKNRIFNKMQFFGTLFFFGMSFFFYWIAKGQTGYILFLALYGLITFIFLAFSNLITQFSKSNVGKLTDKTMEIIFSSLFLPLFYFPSTFVIFIYYRFSIILINQIGEQRKKELIIYLLLTFILFFLRFFSQKINDLVYQIWSKDSYLNNRSNLFAGTRFWKTSIYFLIAITIVLSQIDKAFYNVFNNQFENILIPSAVTLIAFERVIQALKK